MRFDELDLSDDILDALDAMRFDKLHSNTGNSQYHSYSKDAT